MQSYTILLCILECNVQITTKIKGYSVARRILFVRNLFYASPTRTWPFYDFSYFTTFFFNLYTGILFLCNLFTWKLSRLRFFANVFEELKLRCLLEVLKFEAFGQIKLPNVSNSVYYAVRIFLGEKEEFCFNYLRLTFSGFLSRKINRCIEVAYIFVCYFYDIQYTLGMGNGA